MARQTRKDAFYQNASWYIRYRELNQAGNTIYKLKGGFGTAKEAEEYKAHCEEEYLRKSRYNSVLNADMTITEYLTIWYEETYRNTPIENNRKMVCDYAIYSWILPNIETDIKISAIYVEYLDEMLGHIAANSWSAAETARELLILAFNDAVMAKRKELVDKQKELVGDEYYDNDYISCQENGLPHNVASLNQALTKICSAANVPHTSVHGLRHMYASILLDNSVSLPKVSALLGHRSVNTTFENYADSVKGGQDIVDFINKEFKGDGNAEI